MPHRQNLIYPQFHPVTAVDDQPLEAGLFERLRRQPSLGLAHEDDVKILRAKEKLDQIPEDTKDPGLLRMRKDLKRKMPTRRSTEQYWTEQQWQKLLIAPPLKLTSRGPIPWRLLAYMLEASPEVEPIRKLVGKRLLESTRFAGALKQLDQMLMTLWAAGYVRLEPVPPTKEEGEGEGEREKATVKKPLLDVTIRPADSPSRPLSPSPPPASAVPAAQS